MEKEKRIEEMAEVIMLNYKPFNNKPMYTLATALYNAGYRKQEDILHEWVDRETAYLNEIAELKKELKKELDEHEEFTKKAKAEIERLTEESDEMFDRHAKENQAASILIEQRNNEIAELQKKVDILQESHYITYERAVKTTAQKILQDLFYFIDGNNFWLEETGNQVFLIKENDALNFMRKKASEYEVEVEE